jgi:hypothetical protein
MSVYIAYYLYILGTFCVYKLAASIPSINIYRDFDSTRDRFIFILVSGTWPILAMFAILASIKDMIINKETK